MDITQIIKETGFSFKKKYGQNFITDKNLLNAIVADADVCSEDVVLEIGAGAGTLTLALAEKAKRVVSFEIDENLKPILSQVLGSYSNVEIIYADVLSFDKTKLMEILGGKFKLVANLPYYITTPIIFNFLHEPLLQSITIMVQKEVAQRICAEADSADYGALSAQVQSVSSPKIKRIVSKKLFVPIPEVDSAIVNIPIDYKCSLDILPMLKRVIAAAFAMRRKTLVNNLMAGFCLKREQAMDAVTSCGLTLTVRGESLNVYQFIELSEKLKNMR